MTATVLRNVTRAYLDKHGLRHGTHPENLAALRLHQWNIPFVQQYRVGKYHLDFAVLETRTAIEIDGPHHLRPDVAHKDVIRDTELRADGWLVLRVTAGETIDEDQLLRAALVARGDARHWPVKLTTQAKRA
jgi:very-short-patch-repair endonuclease